MSGSLAQRVIDYGHFAVAIGTSLEGEAVSLLAGLAPHQGALSIPLVVLIAFCGGACSATRCFLTSAATDKALDRLCHRLPRLHPAQHRAGRLSGWSGTTALVRGARRR